MILNFLWYFANDQGSSVALKERRGSSPYAIAKYMEEKHKYVLPLNYKKILFLQMKNSIVRGKLIKIKASYKLSEMAKEEKVTTTTTKAVKKPDAAKKAVKKVTKKLGPKKTKKSTPAKPKQLKLIKSPTAKRAKRTVA
nr:histone h1 [Quercus suber]